ncbi:MAG: succinylglutamate desuccinylase, partial [Butyrivibrio sp.]|nr:succinylglutamate desuccinylase [Butyrivibrio sp.]
DNTDINRMFPGYNEGETTQRLADNIFNILRDYKYGIQLASFYIPGEFLPHVRLMNTEYTEPTDGYLFGLPYFILRNPKPYDTTTLNYNWQVFGTAAFSLYTKATDRLDEESAEIAVEAILRFLDKKGFIELPSIGNGINTKYVPDSQMINIQTIKPGLFRPLSKAGAVINKGDTIAEILCPYTAEVLEKVVSPCKGQIFFVRHAEAIMAHDLIYRIVPA